MLSTAEIKQGRTYQHAELMLEGKVLNQLKHQKNAENEFTFFFEITIRIMVLNYSLTTIKGDQDNWRIGFEEKVSD